MSAQEVGRASYKLSEIAARNAISVASVYRHVNEGLLKVCCFGSGRRPCMRVTPQQERAWLDLLAGGSDA
jgi:DNA-binding IscR family transcriptional regulator